MIDGTYELHKNEKLPDFKSEWGNTVSYEIEYREKELAAYEDLKIKIVNVMHDFILKYATKGENCLYPQCGYILADVLHDCWQEACNQMNTKVIE